MAISKEKGIFLSNKNAIDSYITQFWEVNKELQAIANYLNRVELFTITGLKWTDYNVSSYARRKLNLPKRINRPLGITKNKEGKPLSEVFKDDPDETEINLFTEKHPEFKGVFNEVNDLNIFNHNPRNIPQEADQLSLLNQPQQYKTNTQENNRNIIIDLDSEIIPSNGLYHKSKVQEILERPGNTLNKPILNTWVIIEIDLKTKKTIIWQNRFFESSATAKQVCRNLINAFSWLEFTVQELKKYEFNNYNK